MSKVPFFADASAMSDSSPPAMRREIYIFVIYIVLSMISSIALNVGDNAAQPVTRLAAALWLFGAPALIWITMKKLIDRHADEMLKAKYDEAFATAGLSSFILAIIWFLWGRWLYPALDGTSDPSKFIVTLCPYLIIWFSYSFVRTEMKKLAGGDDA